MIIILLSSKIFIITNNIESEKDCLEEKRYIVSITRPALMSPGVGDFWTTKVGCTQILHDLYECNEVVIVLSNLF